jgi:hypothetical protein
MGARMSVRPVGRGMAALMVVVSVLQIRPAAGSPGDIFSIPAPAIAADPPKAADIKDGDAHPFRRRRVRFSTRTRLGAARSKRYGSAAGALVFIACACVRRNRGGLDPLGSYHHRGSFGGPTANAFGAGRDRASVCRQRPEAGRSLRILDGGRKTAGARDRAHRHRERRLRARVTRRAEMQCERIRKLISHWRSGRQPAPCMGNGRQFGSHCISRTHRRAEGVNGSRLLPALRQLACDGVPAWGPERRQPCRNRRSASASRGDDFAGFRIGGAFQVDAQRGSFYIQIGRASRYLAPAEPEPAPSGASV